MNINQERTDRRNLIFILATACRRRCLQIMESRYFLPCAFLAMAFFLHTTGECAAGNDAAVLDKLTTSTIDTIFSPWVRKAALGFGAGFGLFQSYMGGSIKPLLSWGGLGLAVNYVPKVIELIASVGA